MDFRFTEAQDSLRQEVREFLIKELPPDWAKRVFIPVEDVCRYEEFWAVHKRLAPKLGEKGWLSMSWPKEYGGSNASHVTNLVFQEELYSHGAPGRDTYGVGMIASAIIDFGTEEQKLRHLKPIAKGEVFWCEGFSEPEAGSDMAAIQTRAVEDGDDFIINGQKVWTTGAHHADWSILIARTDPDAPKHRGISCFLVDMKTPGITVSPIIGMDGLQESDEVFFDDVRVPRENLLGEKNQGWGVALAVLNYERSWIESVAVPRRLFEEVVKYIKETSQDPTKNPLISQRLAEIAIEAEVARLFSYRAVWLQDKGLKHESTYQASICHLFNAQLMQHVCFTAMELLGLYGLLKEGSSWAPLMGRVPDLYLGNFGWGIGGGTNEIQRNIIAWRGLGLPRG